jgi:hypothetical protein
MNVKQVIENTIENEKAKWSWLFKINALENAGYKLPEVVESQSKDASVAMFYIENAMTKMLEIKGTVRSEKARLFMESMDAARKLAFPKKEK